jgi:hypothetical protein
LALTETVFVVHFLELLQPVTSVLKVFPLFPESAIPGRCTSIFFGMSGWHSHTPCHLASRATQYACSRNQRTREREPDGVSTVVHSLQLPRRDASPPGHSPGRETCFGSGTACAPRRATYPAPLTGAPPVGCIRSVIVHRAQSAISYFSVRARRGGVAPWTR